MDAALLDLRHAVRAVVSAPRLAAIIIATLALGTGANTAVFSVLNAVVLTPLSYHEPDRLVRVYHASPGDDSGYFTGLAAIGYRDRSQTLAIGITYTYSVQGADITDGAEPERVTILPVGADYFRVLDARPIVGQPFDRADERRNANVAVISERLWRTYLGGRSDAVGRQLTFDGIPHRIVAVLPDSFGDPLVPGVEVWSALNLQPGPPNSFDNYYLSMVARLKPGVTAAQAQAELTALAASMQTDRPASAERWFARVVPLQVDTVGSARSMLWTLLGAVGLLMMIACVNVASLLLARGAEREADLAVRVVLGASRTRLVRQLLLESVLLSVAGAVAALLLAPAVTRLLLSVAPTAVADLGSNALDRAVLAFSIGMALLAGVGFGVAPAVHAARTNLEACCEKRDAAALAAGGRHARATRSWSVRSRWRSSCSSVRDFSSGASIGFARYRSVCGPQTS